MQIRPHRNKLVARNPLAFLYLYDIIQNHSARDEDPSRNDEVGLGSESRSSIEFCIIKCRVPRFCLRRHALDRSTAVQHRCNLSMYIRLLKYASRQILTRRQYDLTGYSECCQPCGRSCCGKCAECGICTFLYKDDVARLQRRRHVWSYPVSAGATYRRRRT